MGTPRTVSQQAMQLFTGTCQAVGRGSTMAGALHRMTRVIEQHIQSTFTEDKWKTIWEVLLQQLQEDGMDVNTPEGQQRLLNMAIVVLTKSIQKRLDAEMKNTQLPQDQLDYLKDLTRALDAEVKKSENGQRGGPQRGGPQPGGAQRGGAQRGGPQHGGPQIGGPQQSGGQHGGGQQNGGRSGWSVFGR